MYTYANRYRSYTVQHLYAESGINEIIAAMAMDQCVGRAHDAQSTPLGSDCDELSSCNDQNASAPQCDVVLSKADKEIH